MSLHFFDKKQEFFVECNFFFYEYVVSCIMRHYRIHISTSKVETIELAKSTYAIQMMSYGLN